MKRKTKQHRNARSTALKQFARFRWHHARGLHHHRRSRLVIDLHHHRRLWSAIARCSQSPPSLAFDTPNSKKSLPSRVVNAVIFGIDEQYNLNFETALFTNCKTYNIFLFSGARFNFFLFFSFSFPCLYSISHSCSKSHRY